MACADIKQNPTIMSELVKYILIPAPTPPPITDRSYSFCAGNVQETDPWLIIPTKPDPYPVVSCPPIPCKEGGVVLAFSQTTPSAVTDNYSRGFQLVNTDTNTVIETLIYPYNMIVGGEGASPTQQLFYDTYSFRIPEDGNYKVSFIIADQVSTVKLQAYNFMVIKPSRMVLS